MSLGPRRAWGISGVIAATAVIGGGSLLLAADTKYRGSLSTAAIYDENVYLSSDDLGEEPRSSSGGAATGSSASRVSTPRRS